MTYSLSENIDFLHFSIDVKFFLERNKVAFRIMGFARIVVFNYGKNDFPEFVLEFRFIQDLVEEVYYRKRKSR